MPAVRRVSSQETPLPIALRRMDEDRMRRYRDNLAFYEGRQWEGRARRGERRLTFNYARAFCDKVTSYLVTGLSVQVVARDAETEAGRARARAAEQALRQVEAANGLAQLDFETELDCAVLGDAGLHQWMREQYRVNRELPAGPLLQTAARALTITGRVLQGIEQQQRVKAQRAVWMTRAGLALQALLALSTPGSLAASVVRHWVHRLYLFALLLAGAGFLFATPAARNLGFGLLVVIALLDLLLRVAGDAQHRRWGWLKFAVGLLIGGLLGLAALGLWGGLRLGWLTLLGL